MLQHRGDIGPVLRLMIDAVGNHCLWKAALGSGGFGPRGRTDLRALTETQTLPHVHVAPHANQQNHTQTDIHMCTQGTRTPLRRDCVDGGAARPDDASENGSETREWKYAPVSTSSSAGDRSTLLNLNSGNTQQQHILKSHLVPKGGESYMETFLNHPVLKATSSSQKMPRRIKSSSAQAAWLLLLHTAEDGKVPSHGEPIDRQQH